MNHHDDVVLRLRPLVEPLHAPDGALYLIQGAGPGDCVIREPSVEVVAIVDALGVGGTAGDIAAACVARGVATETAAVREVAGALRAHDLLEPSSGASVLDPEDAERFDRQLLYLRQLARDTDGADCQLALRSARIVIIGCGGLGSAAAWGLATVGIGELVLVDPDVVELSNLNRQLLFAATDVGRSKAHVTAERLLAFDPQLAVTVVVDRVRSASDVAALVRGADMTIACADTPAYEIARWINDGCASEGVPHISAGQMPPALRVGPFVKPGETACIRCVEHALRRDNPLAEPLERQRRESPRPAATLGPACGVIGSFIALEVLHWLTGLAAPATWNAVLTLDIRTLTTEHVHMRPDPACSTCVRQRTAGSRLTRQQ